VQQFSFGTTSATVGPISPGSKLFAADSAVQLAFGTQADVASRPKFHYNSRPEFFTVNSAASYMAGAALVGTSVVSFYDIGAVWDCEPPPAPVHVVTLYDADYYYELDIHTATEVLFSVDVDTSIAFASTFVELLTANYFPIKSKVIYRWRLDNAHRFVHFDFATAAIASGKEFTALRRFEGFTAARKKALRALPKRP
jgi:hypothetical protein